MNGIDLNFEQTVARMTFSCRSGEIVPAERQVESDDGIPESPPPDAESKVAAAIADQLSVVQQDLNSLRLVVQSTAIEFAESFVGLLFECDTDLVKEKIVSNLKVALTDVETGNGITIYLNPQMMKKIEHELPKIATTQIQVASDPLLDLSDCRIEGAGKSLVARLQRQLEAAKHRWLMDYNDKPTDS